MRKEVYEREKSKCPCRIANEALYQMSYRPEFSIQSKYFFDPPVTGKTRTSGNS